jgi:hypothetical protein
VDENLELRATAKNGGDAQRPKKVAENKVLNDLCDRPTGDDSLHTSIAIDFRFDSWLE